MAKAVRNSKRKSGAKSGAKGGGKAAAKRTRSKAGASRSGARPRERKGFLKFLRDVRVEMSKVTWPTRRDLAQSTLVVLVAVAISGALIFAYDTVFAWILEYVLPK